MIKNKNLIFIIIGLFVIALILGGVFYFKNKENNKNEAQYIEGRTELNINNLGDLSKIKNLYIKSSSTSDNPIPYEVFQNVQLETLALNNLGYKEIPSEIGNLVNLKMLFLNDNQLTSLPDSFSNLSKLEFLNLAGNNFEKIPEVLYKLKNLKKIIVVNNKNLSKEEQQKLINAFSNDIVVADINYKPLDFSPINTSTITSTATSSALKKNIDLSRKRPDIPFGRQVFQVYQNENVLPKIWEAVIDPPDVRVGQKQKLSIVVESPYDIKEVKAITKLDKSTKTIYLKYIKDVSENDLSKRHFSVFNNEFIPKNKLVELFDNFLIRAFSGESSKKLYEVEWVVEDTHDEIYYTTFYVKDSKNNENSVTIAWSDPCNIPNGGDWNLGSYGNCTISSPDGVDNGNVTIQTYTLTLNSTFVFNPGKTITISSGSIVVGSGGQIQKAYIYLQDADNDNYIPQSSYTQYTNSSASWSSPYKRRYLFSALNYSDCNDYDATIGAGSYYYFDNDGDGYGAGSGSFSCSSPGAGYVTNNSDCYDYNSNARPGQTSYFTVSRGDGSFDYDCNNFIFYSTGNLHRSALSRCVYQDGSCFAYLNPVSPNGGWGSVPGSQIGCNTPPCLAESTLLGSVADCGQWGYYWNGSPHPGCFMSNGYCYSNYPPVGTYTQESCN